MLNCSKRARAYAEADLPLQFLAQQGHIDEVWPKYALGFVFGMAAQLA